MIREGLTSDSRRCSDVLEQLATSPFSPKTPPKRKAAKLDLLNIPSAKFNAATEGRRCIALRSRCRSPPAIPMPGQAVGHGMVRTFAQHSRRLFAPITCVHSHERTMLVKVMTPCVGTQLLIHVGLAASRGLGDVFQSPPKLGAVKREQTRQVVRKPRCPNSHQVLNQCATLGSASSFCLQPETHPQKLRTAGNYPGWPQLQSWRRRHGTKHTAAKPGRPLP